MGIDLTESNPDWLGEEDDEYDLLFSEMHTWEERYRAALSLESTGDLIPYDNVLEFGYRAASNLEAMLEEEEGYGNAIIVDLRGDRVHETSPESSEYFSDWSEEKVAEHHHEVLSILTDEGVYTPEHLEQGHKVASEIGRMIDYEPL